MRGAKPGRKRKRAFDAVGPTPDDRSHKQSNNSSKPGSAKRLRLNEERLKTHNLNLEKLLYLPPLCIARVCNHLHPLDLISLSRACRSLRSFFMKETSQSFWEESCSQVGLPSWPHVPYPQAIVFLYGENFCQGETCQAESQVKCFFLCRKYCRPCARHNLLDLKEVHHLAPALSADLISRLPWTGQRPGHSESSTDVETDRFYLRSDIVKLQARVQALASQPSWAMTALGKELSRIQKEKKKASFDMRVWLSRMINHEERHFAARWKAIQGALRARWGWNPVAYEDLPSRLKQMVDYLIYVPTLTKQVWDEVRGPLEWSIHNNLIEPEQEARPFTLAKARRLALGLPTSVGGSPDRD